MSEQSPAEIQRALVRLSVLVQGRSLALDASLQEFRTSLRQSQSWQQSLQLLSRVERHSDDAELDEQQLITRLLARLKQSPALNNESGKLLLASMAQQHSWELVLLNISRVTELLLATTQPNSVQPPATDVLRMRAKISLLLDSLRSYTSAYDTIDELQALLTNAEQQSQLEDVLQRISGFIANLLTKEQQEFEHYLDSLNTHLQQICVAVRASRDLQDSLDLSSGRLQQSLTTTMGDLQDGIVQADTLADLKNRVETNLSVIDQAMRQFQQDEQQKRQEMQQEMASLDRHLQRMNEENERVQRELENSKRQALTDSLTALPNRLAYEQRFQALLAEHPNGLALAVGDIDLFKAINDNFGHQAGDKLLQIVARLMSASMRASDFLCRYGGEEFVLLLPLAHQDDALRVLEKLRKRIGHTRLHFRGQPISVTISFGLAMARPNEDPESLFRRADEALYLAKHQGRDRVVSADSSSSIAS